MSLACRGNRPHSGVSSVFLQSMKRLTVPGKLEVIANPPVLPPSSLDTYPFRESSGMLGHDPYTRREGTEGGPMHFRVRLDAKKPIGGHEERMRVVISIHPAFRVHNCLPYAMQVISPCICTLHLHAPPTLVTVALLCHRSEHKTTAPE